MSDEDRQCWGIRTANERYQLIADELARGRLRQGWGAHDLREIGKQVSGGHADDETRSVWRYTQRMLEINVDDLVVTPHQPDWELNGVWRVTGAYEFDPLPDIWGPGEPDFGHLLKVEPIGTFNHRSAHVDAPLRRAFTTGFRTRMRQLNEFGDQILALIALPDAGQPADAAEHFAVARHAAREALGGALLKQYGNSDFEQPIGSLLEALYPNAVSHTAGPAERGRDFVIDDVDRLGLTRTVIVQVKSWRGPIGPDALQHGLDQLADGVAAQGGDVDMAVLLTLGDSLPPDADLTIALARGATGVPTRVLLRDETLDLILDQIGDMVL